MFYAAYQRTARYRANATTVDFSKPLSEETRPMQKLTNRDIKALQVYVRDLADQMQKFVRSYPIALDCHLSKLLACIMHTSSQQSEKCSCKMN